jgi:hypothetical protein
MSASLRAVVALALALTACSNDKRGAAPAPSASEPAVDAPPPRRPTKKWLLVNNANKCEIYWTDSDATGTPFTTPCPMDLLPGERIRVTGKVCMREGGAPAREQPFVCPDPLTNAEKDDRRDAGLPL